MNKGLTLRLLNRDGAIFDVPMSEKLFDLGFMKKETISYKGRYYVKVSEDNRITDTNPDGKWIRSFREVEVAYIRDQASPSPEARKKEYLERAQKQLDAAEERGRLGGIAQGFHEGMTQAIACVQHFEDACGDSVHRASNHLREDFAKRVAEVKNEDADSNAESAEDVQVLPVLERPSREVVPATAAPVTKTKRPQRSPGFLAMSPEERSRAGHLGGTAPHRRYGKRKKEKKS